MNLPGLRCYWRLERKIGQISQINLEFKKFSTSSNFRKRLTVNDREFMDHFHDQLKKFRKNPWLIIQGYINLFGEFGKLYEEKKKQFYLNNKWFELEETRYLTDMLFTFETKQDLEKFEVFSDETQGVGLSTASLQLTQQGTGLFSGYINSNVKSDYETRRAKGFAGMMSHRLVRSFGRIGAYDWSFYTHLVFKVRGDGRNYLINLSMQLPYDDHKYSYFSYPLHTRGGPYWQITKIPFSHFFFTPKAIVSDEQGDFPLDKINRVGIAVSHNTGPFKLEIDYIGLERNEQHREICPYEQYSLR